METIFAKSKNANRYLFGDTELPVAKATARVCDLEAGIIYPAVLTTAAMKLEDWQTIENDPAIVERISLLESDQQQAKRLAEQDAKGIVQLVGPMGETRKKALAAIAAKLGTTLPADPPAAD